MTAAARSEGDQGRAARIATVAALIVVASFVAGKAARDAILLASFDVNRLPIFVGIASAVSLPVVLLAGRLMTRVGPGRLMPICNLASAALLVVEWLALARWPGPAAIAMFFHIGAVGAVLVSGFWSIVNERFDARTAKRHIGRIGVGATLGGIAGGLVAERTAVLLSADKLLLVLAGLQLVAALALRMLGQSAPRRGNAPTSERGGPALTVIATSSLLRNVAIVVVLGAIAATVLDFVFKARIAGSSSGLLRSLALYYTATNILTAIAQIALSGSLIGRLGVPKSVAALPLAVTALGVAALAIPTLMATAIARGAEAVTRNSIYRAAYELLYAPLPEHHKRQTKVILDVGAERVGDIIGSQLVGATICLVAAPRISLQVAAIVAGALALVFALRLPRSYREALEHHLLLRAPGEQAPARPAWASLGGTSSLTLDETGDLTALSLLRIPTAPPPRSPAAAPPIPLADDTAARIADLRSGDIARVRRALDQPLGPELVPHAIALLAWDAAADAAIAALVASAPRDTAVLVDGLLDPENPFAVRRRLPGILVAGDPVLAIPGLWRGLEDVRFEVRYRSGTALAHVAAAGHAHAIAAEDVFAAVLREISIDLRVWQSHRLLDASGNDVLHRVLARRSSTGLEHVFTLLGLVLPAEPLRIALHAIHTDDPSLRGTALEYLESVLPVEIRARLWPFLEVEGAVRAPGCSRTQVVAALELSHPSIRAAVHAIAQRDLPPAKRRPLLRDLHARAHAHPTRASQEVSA